MATREELPFSHQLHAQSRATPLPAALSLARGAFRSVVNYALTVKRLGVDVEGAISVLAAAGPSIGYDEYCTALDACPPGARTALTTTLFASLPRDAEGRVPVAALIRYLRGRTALRALYARLLAYDSDHDGALAETDFENFVLDSIPYIAGLSSLHEPFYQFYVYAAVRKIFFFLDVNHVGKIPLPVAVASPVLAEWLRNCDAPAADDVHGAGSPPSNWFSASNALRLHRQYLELDSDQNGMLSQAELRSFNGGSLTPVFCARVFEEVFTYGGELDFKAFLEFVLAIEYRGTPQSLRYMFRLFDVTKRGLLVRADIRYFMRAVLDKHASEGHDRLELESCLDEIWDMVKPANASGITLRDLERCKVGHIITHILADSVGFRAYDERESLLHAPLFADVSEEESR